MESSCSCHNHESEKEEKKFKIEYILTLIGILLFFIAIFFKNSTFNISFWIYLASYIMTSYEVIYNAIRNILKKELFDENFLMSLATIGAFVINEYEEAIVVILLYKIGEFLQDKALENSRKKISKALDIRSNIAWIKKDAVIEEIDVKDLKIDDEIIVKTGEKVPVDGVLLSDVSEIDMSALTGESRVITVYKNQEILSGSVNKGSVINLRVNKTFENSAVSKIMELIENLVEKKSKTEKFITRFAKIYTPVVTAIALIIALLPLISTISFSESLQRAFTFLVISCPCALVISVPLGFFVGIGASSKKGILVKGSNYLDILSDAKIVVFDKTGTLTKGTFDISKIVSLRDMEQNEILEIVALCEQFSNHYISKSIQRHYSKNLDISLVKKHEEIAGKGIKAIIKDKNVLVGNYNLLKENNVVLEEVKEIGTILYLAVDGIAQGYIILSDNIKEESIDLVDSLYKIGIKKCIMLTGDSKEIAKDVADKLKIKEVYSKLLPEDKVNKLKEIKNDNIKEKVIFVGDGINDAPVLALADIGISMGKGSDLAIETSDIVLINDNPQKIIEAIKISKRTKSIVKQNIIFAIVIKILFLILSGLGITSMWFAIFADVGVTIITILNSIRIFKIKV